VAGKVFADGRHKVPELVQGLAMLYLDALIDGFQSVNRLTGYMRSGHRASLEIVLWLTL